MIGNLIKERQAMANSASEIYMRLHHHYSDAPPSSGREKNTEKKACQAKWRENCFLLIQYHSAYHHVNRSDDGRDRKRIDLRVPAVDLLSFEVKRVKYLDDQGQIFSANFLDKSGRGYPLYGICPWLAFPYQMCGWIVLHHCWSVLEKLPKACSHLSALYTFHVAPYLSPCTQFQCHLQTICVLCFYSFPTLWQASRPEM